MSKTVTLFISLCIFIGTFSGDRVVSPWAKTAPVLHSLGAEEITYAAAVVSPGTRGRFPCPSLSPVLESLPPGMDVHCCYLTGEAEEVGVWQIRSAAGADELEAVLARLLDRFAADSLTGQITVARTLEALVAAAPGEVESLARTLMRRLGGRAVQATAYQQGISLTGFIPGLEECLEIYGCTINIQIDAYYDTYLKRVKVRVGMPVLPQGV